jgi:hypothetical protein
VVGSCIDDPCTVATRHRLAGTTGKIYIIATVVETINFAAIMLEKIINLIGLIVMGWQGTYWFFCGAG